MSKRTAVRTTEHIPYTRTEETSHGRGHRTEMRERHESFGLVGVNRITVGGGARSNMFGSHLDHHPTLFRFRVQRAVRVHTDLAYDRFHSDGEADRTQLLEFDLTATQFVELMTSLNVGEGIPCTLRYVLGEQMEDVPGEHETEAQNIARKFAAEMKDIAGSVKPLTGRIATIMAKPTIGKRDREDVVSLVGQIVRQFDDHAPFVMNQFVESTGRLVTAGKAEVEAYAMSVVMAAGIEHLRQLRERGGDQAVAEAVQALDVGGPES
jgi:hypothetical protein